MELKNIFRVRKRVAAAALAGVLLASAVLPQIVNAFDVRSDLDTHPNVWPTWTDETAAKAELFDPVHYHATGMYFNENFYFGNGQSGFSWPLGAQMYLEPRDGRDNSGYEEFEFRHLYCTGNHTVAAAIQPGARAFESGRYNTEQTFEPAVTGKDNPTFNFLMLAIACNYPGEYRVPANAESIAEDAVAAEGAVVQLIAWLCTDSSSQGFTGTDYATDYQIFRSSGYYGMLESSMQVADKDIYDALFTDYGAGSGDPYAGIYYNNYAQGIFFDIWWSAYITSFLTPDFINNIVTATATIYEDGGSYRADVDLFASAENDAQIDYLTGIEFVPSGDWQLESQTEDGVMHFVSSSGELDESGCIGYLTWPDDVLGGLMPKDMTRAEIRTFDTYNVIAGGLFGRTQTQFTSYIDNGINIYLTPGTDQEVESEVSVVRRKHEEPWTSHYIVNLYKFDSETGKAIEGSTWDILEKFDDTQLEKTDLDRTPDAPGTYQSGLGSLISTPWGTDDIASNYSGNMGVTVSDTNKYNWGNDNGTQFDKWDDPYEDPCDRDENVTGEDGRLYEVLSNGSTSTDVAHTDVYGYNYIKGYCEGHPAPVIDYVECDHDDEDDCDCEEINQELHDEAWAAWYEEVKTCEQLVEEGGFFHCIEPGEAAKLAMQEDRDQFYKDFISLTYEYSAEETEAAEGYILHGNHTDDIPIEWRVVTSSEYKDTGEATTLEYSTSKMTYNGSSGSSGDTDDEDDDGDDDDNGTNTAALTYSSVYGSRATVSDADEAGSGNGAVSTTGTEDGTAGTDTADTAAGASDAGNRLATLSRKTTWFVSSSLAEAYEERSEEAEVEAEAAEESEKDEDPDTGEADAADTEEDSEETKEQDGASGSGSGTDGNGSTDSVTIGATSDPDEEPESAAETGSAAAASIKETAAAEEETEDISDDASYTDDDGEEVYLDIEILDDGTYEVIDGATGSNATASNAHPTPERVSTGFLSAAKAAARGLLSRAASALNNLISTLSLGSDDDDDGGSSSKARSVSASSGSYLRNSITFKATTANYVAAPLMDIIDWTFIVYDHRTEGEIHFNKRDFDLVNDEDETLFDAYAQENGDGTLEGALYGLFAAEDIIHPDTTSGGESEYDTGVVFEQGDLVAVAATDRNGDASFMAITEAPGSVYNYETGRIEHTDWYSDAPKNLHIPEEESAEFAEDIEMFVGHNPDNSEITGGNDGDLIDTSAGDGSMTDEFFWKYSSNQEYDSGLLSNNAVTNATEDTYREDNTTGHYPIADNESNNGNCWIGRPIIIGPSGSSYYIRELSRSEGYELSVYGKSEDLVTNRDAWLAGGEDLPAGSAAATSISRDMAYGGATFTVTSSNTADGYELHLTNIPEGATIYMTETELVWDDSVSHTETVTTYEPIPATEGAPVMVGGKTWEAGIGDTIDYNGYTFTVNNVYEVNYGSQTVKPDNEMMIENPYLDAASIDESGDLVKDVNRLFTKSGFRTPDAGSPWVCVELAETDASSVTLASLAEAINDSLFADGWYAAFNAMAVTDIYDESGHVYAVVHYNCQKGSVNSAIYNSANDSIYVKTDAEYTGLSGADGYIYRVYAVDECEDVVRNSEGFVTSAVVPNQTAEGSATYEHGDPYSTITFVTKSNTTYWAYADGEYLLNSDGSYATKAVKTTQEVTPTQVMKAVNETVEADSYTQKGTSSDGYGYGEYVITITQEQIDALADGTITFRIDFPDDASGTSASKVIYSAT